MKDNELGNIVEYDAFGKVTSIKTYIGNNRYSTIYFQYDDKDRITIYKSNDYNTTYEYDDNDNIIHIVYSSVFTTNTESSIILSEEWYSYDEQNRLRQKKVIDNEEMREIWYRYDIKGNINYRKSIDEDGYITEQYHEYDEPNRVIYTKNEFDDKIEEYWYKYNENNERRIYKESRTYKNI